MKKLSSFFITSLALCACFVSCSNDTEEQCFSAKNTRLESSNDQISSEELLSLEDFDSSALATKRYRAAPIEEASIQAVKINYSSSGIIKAHGYTTKQERKIKTVILKNQADAMHIPVGLYVAKYVTCTLKVKHDGLGVSKKLSIEDSPLCGFEPNNDDWSRGYTMGSSYKSSEGTLKTLLVYVICDIGGRRYNMWYPCKPENIEWNYSIIDK